MGCPALTPNDIRAMPELLALTSSPSLFAMTSRAVTELVLTAWPVDHGWYEVYG
jgi:hypothetical protein